MRFPTGPILELEQYFALLDYTTEVRNEALYGPTAERVLPEWVTVACDVLDMDTKQLSSCDSFIWVGDEDEL
tara:strand:- start:77 stop:292 length:216 start_codon:yes stop_codon:yes gene_type:complete